jgi:membrane protein YqaA with SNARE-associated domain
MSGEGEAGLTGGKAQQQINTLERWRKILRHAIPVVLAVVITITVVLLADDIRRFQAYGYPGVFVVSLLGNATLLLPAPSITVVFAMGHALNPVIVGLVAGIGEALGELTGYMAGYGGRAVIKDREMYKRLEERMSSKGGPTIFILSVIPNPFFDLAGIAAGAWRFPIQKFLFYCWAGKTIKSLLVALAGYSSIGWVSGFFFE